MVLYCAALDCKSNGFDVGISFHKFPKEEKLKKIWLEKIQRWAMTITDNTVLCSKHFMDSDYVNPNHKRRRLVSDAVPSVFAWTKVIPEKRRLKRDYSKISSSQVSTADLTASPHENGDKSFAEAAFSIVAIRQKSELVELYTGFPNYEHFYLMFRFFLPNDVDEFIKYFTVEDCGNGVTAESDCITAENQFLLTMMRFRLALPTADLAFRFRLTSQQASRILTTWINYMYIRLSSIVFWPPRLTILNNSPKSFTAESVVAVVAGAQLSVDSSRLTSQRNSVKGCRCIIVSDPNGSIMFTSQMYEESVSYGEIATESGLIKLMQGLLEKEHLSPGDTIMVDPKVELQTQLEGLGLRSKNCLCSADETLCPSFKSLTALRRFQVFDGRPVPAELMDLVDQMWSCACFLKSFIPRNATLSSDSFL